MILKHFLGFHIKALFYQIISLCKNPSRKKNMLSLSLCRSLPPAGAQEENPAGRKSGEAILPLSRSSSFPILPLFWPASCIFRDQAFFRRQSSCLPQISSCLPKISSSLSDSRLFRRASLSRRASPMLSAGIFWISAASDSGYRFLVLIPASDFWFQFGRFVNYRFLVLIPASDFWWLMPEENAGGWCRRWMPVCI